MPQGSYRIHIRKDALKFSSAHMTVFPDGSKEALHGHNYRTELSVDLRDASLATLISFSQLKGIMKGICQGWDEKVLLPEACPYFKLVKRTDLEVEFTLCGKRYVLPADEVVFLPVDNVTTERLAEEFCRRFVAKLDPQVSKAILGVQVKIEEIAGQGTTFIWIASGADAT